MAVAALAAHRRRQRGIDTAFTVADAVPVQSRAPVEPNPAWAEAYRVGLRAFEGRLRSTGSV